MYQLRDERMDGWMARDIEEEYERTLKIVGAKCESENVLPRLSQMLFWFLRVLEHRTRCLRFW